MYRSIALQPSRLKFYGILPVGRWGSGSFLSIGSSDVDWVGEDKITTYTSSEWAERGFCSLCGSSLFYRVTAPGPHQGRWHIAFGTVDDQSGIDMNLEYFIDLKPEAYTFAGERKKLTEAEVFEIFSGSSA